MNIVDITYDNPKTTKLNNISKYEQIAKDSAIMLSKEAGTISDRPSTYNILTDYYNHLISYYAGNPTLLDAFFLYQYSDTMITIFDALNRKIFKGGFLKNALKDNPNKEEEKMIDHLLSYANENGEDLVEVFKQVETAANWSNLRTLLILKEYKKKDGEYVTSAIKQILHIDPLTVEPIKDKAGRLGYEQYSNDGKTRKCYFSLKQRNALIYEEKSNGQLNLQADYRVLTDNGYMYYNRTELIVKKKFPANPMFALKNKILAMIAQDKHIMNEYSEGKPTKKMLLFKGRNIEEVREALKEYSNAVRENPNKLHPLMMGGVEGNQQLTEVIDLVKSLDEMQATEMRNEFRNAMGAPYGVSPVYQNDVSTGGGLNNEGLQISVTNEAIESNKDCYDQFLKHIFNVMLGVQDWEVRLYPNEEEDEAHIEDLLTKKIGNAEKILALGGDVEFVPDNKDKVYSFIYKKQSLEKKEEGFNPFNSGGQPQPKQTLEDLNKESKIAEPKSLPKTTALESAMDDFEKEYQDMVKQVLDKHSK